MTKDSAAIRDQLGNDPDITFVLNPNYTETYGLEEGPSTVSATTLGHSWICGSTSNGIVGVNTNTEDGSQQVVGSAGQVQGVVRVVNPNNTFHEHFRDNDFEDTGVTTANWDTVNFEISFTASQIAQSKSIFLNEINIYNAIFTVTGTTLNNATLYLSADGGTNWEEFDNGELKSFVNTGTDLRFKIIAEALNDFNLETDASENIVTNDGSQIVLKSTSAGALTITEINIKYNI